MRFTDAYTIVITEKLAECRDFYSRWFGFEVGFEASWIVWMHNEEGVPASIAFMHPEHPSTPPAPGAFHGDGMFLTFQVEDAAAEYSRLTAEGLRCDLELTDEPWGQRRFGVIDPAGVWVDVVQQTQPQAGWWEPFMRS